MKRPPRALLPLALLPESQDPSRMGVLFRAAHDLPEDDLPALLPRLRASQRAQRRRPGRVLRIALAFGLVFGLGGVVGAMVRPFRVLDPSPQAAPSAPAPASSSPRRSRPVLAPAPIPEPPPTATPVEAAKSAPVPIPEFPPIAPPVVAAKPAPAAPLRRPARTQPQREDSAFACPQVAFAPPPPVAPPVSAVPAAPPIALEQAQFRPAPVAPPASAAPVVTPMAAEHVLLRQAMHALHTDHDARAALALLEEHARRFSAGAWRSEAGVLRTEALLRLGRNDQALALLDAMPLLDLPNRAEHLVVRGELRAARGRWREALGDFDAALRGQPAVVDTRSDVHQRALWGRASARSRLGDPQGARADLDLYLRQYPSGRFAGSAADLSRLSP